MGSVAVIRKLTVTRFRGIEQLEWRPAAGMNIVLGGGDLGKTTVLEAIALLLSPTNSTTVSESDYWQRDNTQEFQVEAAIAFFEDSGINTQQSFTWPTPTRHARSSQSERRKAKMGEPECTRAWVRTAPCN